MATKTKKAKLEELDKLSKKLKRFKEPTYERVEHLAKLIALFDHGENPKEVRQLNLEWTVDKYVQNKVEANLPDILFIHEKLKEHGHTEKNPYVYNDLDNKLFYFPHDSRKVFAMTSQNLNFLVIYEESGTALKKRKLHIRRYWDRFDKNDTFREEEDRECRKKGMRYAITRADWINENYSDNVPGNMYVNRPDLQWFKYKKFNLDFSEKLHWTKYSSYGDCRDHGYVLSYEEMALDKTSSKKVEATIDFFSLIRHAFFDIRCAYEEMKDLEQS